MSNETNGAPAKPAAHMDVVRGHLIETLAALRDRDNPMEIDRARAVAQVAGVLVDTAKVEVDYLKITGQDRSGFLEQPPDPAVAHLGNTPAAPAAPAAPATPFSGLVHRIRG